MEVETIAVRILPMSRSVARRQNVVNAGELRLLLVLILATGSHQMLR